MVGAVGDPQLGLGQLQMAHGSGVQLQVRSQLANLKMRMRFDFSYYLIQFPNGTILFAVFPLFHLATQHLELYSFFKKFMCHSLEALENGYKTVGVPSPCWVKRIYLQHTHYIQQNQLSLKPFSSSEDQL